MKGLITPLFYAERLPFYGRLRLLYLGSLSSLNVNSRFLLAEIENRFPYCPHPHVGCSSCAGGGNKEKLNKLKEKL